MPDGTAPEKLIIDLGEKGLVLEFSTPEELHNFAITERERWGFLDHQRSIYDGFHNILQNYVGRWRSNLTEPHELQRIFEETRNTVRQHYFGSGAIHSESPDGIFIQNLRRDFGDAATGAHWFLSESGQSIGNLRPEYVVGILEAQLYRKDLTAASPAYRESLEKLRSEFQSESQHQKERFRELEVLNAALNTDFRTILDSQTKEIVDQKERQETEFQTRLQTAAANIQGLIAATGEECKAVSKTYDEKLALQAPVTYWETVNKFHVGRAKIFTWITIISGAVTAGVGYALIRHFLISLKPGESPAHWQLGVLLGFAFLFIWALRILIRLLMSHIHLATDSAERRTMILTYLALVREGKEVAPDDKKLILQHIFRAASDGLVKDDAAPPGIWEVLTRGK